MVSRMGLTEVDRIKARQLFDQALNDASQRENLQNIMHELKGNFDNVSHSHILIVNITGHLIVHLQSSSNFTLVSSMAIPFTLRTRQTTGLNMSQEPVSHTNGFAD